MSWFGDGTLKQEILDEVKWRATDVNHVEIASALIEVAQYFLKHFDYEAEIYLKAKEDAKKEIIATLVKEE